MLSKYKEHILELVENMDKIKKLVESEEAFSEAQDWVKENGDQLVGTKTDFYKLKATLSYMAKISDKFSK